MQASDADVGYCDWLLILTMINYDNLMIFYDKLRNYDYLIKFYDILNPQLDTFTTRLKTMLK